MFIETIQFILLFLDKGTFSILHVLSLMLRSHCQQASGVFIFSRGGIVLDFLYTKIEIKLFDYQVQIMRTFVTGRCNVFSKVSHILQVSGHSVSGISHFLPVSADFSCRFSLARSILVLAHFLPTLCVLLSNI